jgi:hypothetical protein
VIEEMSSNPQLNANNYILNIVPTQNIITNISGLTPIDILTREVTQIQEMVDYTAKRINANTIASFANATDPISVVNSMNLCNANLYSYFLKVEVVLRLFLMGTAHLLEVRVFFLLLRLYHSIFKRILAFLLTQIQYISAVV